MFVSQIYSLNANEVEMGDFTKLSDLRQKMNCQLPEKKREVI